MSKRILVITPRFPLPALGACEKDRFEGIKQLKRLGFDMHIVGKVFDFQSTKNIEDFSRQYDIPITLLPYESQKAKNGAQRAFFYLKRFINPLYWDGAAYEYAHKETIETVKKITDEWQPDVVWFDYTYLWPLYFIFQKRHIPIITRSINVEPTHFLEEDGRTFGNYLKFLPKLISELITIKKSDFLFAITPDEEKVYKKYGAKKVEILPLRGLPMCLRERHMFSQKEPLNVFFMGSTYNVHHNKEALRSILRDIAPRVMRTYPRSFKFHILGTKVPQEFNGYFNEYVIYAGRKLGKELDDFLDTMDIALIPSLMGAGMQQKIFEPLARGIPAVISPRGMAGYQFKENIHVLFARTPKEFADALVRLRDTELRRELSKNSRLLSSTLFSQEKIDNIILNVLNQWI
ncbi:MAG: glycosyltransferase family 4 protein [Parcubacteria group bacterium]|nr:glycosyltransferase family 4 protein [Parcubacteria group bacterium]